MKKSRLLVYGAAGIVAGLLLENGSLRLKEKLSQKVRKAKKDLSRKS